MNVEVFVQHLKKMGIDSLIGVPDSTLKVFCDYVNSEGSNVFNHFVPANEGAAVGLAVGNYLATGHPACVYMQNSGVGNIVNPVTSIAHADVYDIPMLFLIGWRGEPGKKDEPQHKFMGRITESILDVLEIGHEVIGEETTDEELSDILLKAAAALKQNRQYAVIIKKNTFDDRKFFDYANEHKLVREKAIDTILESLNKDDVIISTTGKISREVYEESDRLLGDHKQAFLTVGGMGHASMIALGYAKQRPDKKVFCIDGDGAVLMHMGSLAFLAKQSPDNMVHICLNNEAHESVGGMPTGAAGISYAEIAKSCGYPVVKCVTTDEELKQAMAAAKKNNKLTFIEVMVAMDSRADLGRPKESAVENKENFMEYHGVK
ncbi:MAG: phosphonopyruvate decarboxylase [Lachnospiraceae bacterium]